MSMGPPLVNPQAAFSQLSIVEAGSSATIGAVVSYVMPRAVKEAEGPAKSKGQRAMKDALYSGAAALINNGTSIGYYLPMMTNSPVPAKAVSEGVIFAGLSMVRGPKQRTIKSAFINLLVGTAVATASQKIVVPYFVSAYGESMNDVIPPMSRTSPSTPAATGSPGFAS